MARASPTASSRRASGERAPSARSRGGIFSAGWTTSARPVDLPSRSAAGVKLEFAAFLARLEQLHRLRRHHGRDGVLVDKLRMRVAPQQHAEIVEPGDDALQLHAVDQKDRNRRLVLAHVVEEDVLHVLRFLGRHGYFPLSWSPTGPRWSARRGTPRQVSFRIKIG